MTESQVKEIVWAGARTKCQLCGGDLGTTMYDFRVPGYGAWASGCHSCFRSHGGRLGTGFGQKYVFKKTASGQPGWVKTEG